MVSVLLVVAIKCCIQIEKNIGLAEWKPEPHNNKPNHLPNRLGPKQCVKSDLPLDKLFVPFIWICYLLLLFARLVCYK
jgi:hypothetical protein